MKKKIILGILLICVLQTYAQNETNFWNDEMLSISTYQNVPGWIELKDSTNFTANNFFPSNKNAFQMSGNDSMMLISSTTDCMGDIHYKFQQLYKNIKVEGGEYILHEQNNRIVSANGEFVIGLNINDTIPIISEETALTIALDSINASIYAWDTILYLDSDFIPLSIPYPEGELIYTLINEDSEFVANNFVLAYKFDIFALEPYSRDYVYIDAITGELLKIQNRIMEDNCHNGTAQTLYNGQQTIVTYHRWLYNDYKLQDNCRGIVTFLNEWPLTDKDNNWSAISERSATSAHWAAEMTYDFYYYSFGRRGFDNNDAPLYIYVGSPCPDNKARWNGREIELGLGFFGDAGNALVSLDAVGHEFTHGVIDYTAKLKYEKESGALSESFSDIFGTMVEFYAENINGNYFMGEDFWISDGKLRDLSNPKTKNHPNTYLGQYWQSTANPKDWGGVHTNGGVQNYWFYLLAEGGSGINDNGTTYSILPIGRQKAALIAYLNMTCYLTSASDYEDAAMGSIYAARKLFGTCSEEMIQTYNAWRAVGVDVLLSEMVGYHINTDCFSLTYNHSYYKYITRRQIVAINDIYSDCDLHGTTDRSITFIAGNEITLLPGFSSNDKFHAFIRPCTTPSPCYTPSNEIYEISENEEDVLFIQEDQKQEDISIYPNPNEGKFYIELPFDNENVLKLKIINQLGKVILEQDSFDGTIDISPVAKGIYFVSITLKNKVINRKIIIQ